ncbi:CRISPR-associated protein Cas4 [Natrarchaeobaculum aegyptiacum]|uniref:CRISPR-associated exonuclease Cas4 n=1 Tax=Natrarchaeobaculum aegyptiacum TaxID=745377 RepID=A0A2Z2HZI4_9EURY|nr:hypothetical protein [Natrarchaeobaculum aegyptiacum]ARS89138.1 hypothetical protein B1756_04795 [Natrarchaeobaculum aegyptiacum]
MTRRLVSFGDLRSAAFCPRSLYYERTRDVNREPPQSVTSARALERRYEVLLASPDAALEGEPIAVIPGRYREQLAATRDRLRERGDWKRLREPTDRDRLVSGRDCRGIVHKVLAEPLEPVLLSAGEPPPQGVWEPQSVHAVAAAKALAWEHETPIERAWVEYPAHGVVRSLALTTRRKARYRRALRTVRELDGPPPRTHNRAKCNACSFASECGVRTRTLRSMLGFGRGE